MTPDAGASAAHARFEAVVRAIPAGRVCGYGEVARRAGLPGRARMVARWLATASPEDLPWHRVVRSDGRIAFADGSAAFRRQVRRLQDEGVAITAGRVPGMPASSPLDALLWGGDDA